MKSQFQSIVMAYKHLIISIFLIAVSCLTAFSQTVAEGNPPTTIIVSSPPVRYGDTVDMTTFVAGEKWHAGALVGNNGTKDLILEKVVSSDPRLRCKVWHDTVPPTYKVSVWGIVKFDKPVGNF